MSHKSLFEPQSREKMPENWPFALRHEHNLCKKKSCMEKCLPRLERCHGSLKGEVPPIKAADIQRSEECPETTLYPLTVGYFKCNTFVFMY